MSAYIACGSWGKSQLFPVISLHTTAITAYKSNKVHNFRMRGCIHLPPSLFLVADQLTVNAIPPLGAFYRFRPSPKRRRKSRNMKISFKKFQPLSSISFFLLFLTCMCTRIIFVFLSPPLSLSLSLSIYIYIYIYICIYAQTVTVINKYTPNKFLSRFNYL